jgi:tetratricopeptide (TPR) repeat protein
MRATSAILLLAALAARAQQASIDKVADSPHRPAFLALSQAAAGHCDAALPDLAKQFAETPDPELRRLTGLALSQCDLAQGHYDEAVPVLARLKALYPGDADVLYQAARFHMKAWNDTLFEMFQKVPSSYRVNQISAEIFEIQGRYAEAAAEYRKAIEKNPAALDLHFRRGRALLLQSHSAENLALGRREFEAEIGLNPSDAVAEYEIGQILLTSQETAAAVKRFERAASLDPGFAEALQAVARARMDAKQYDEAIALLEKVVRLQPANESAHYSLMLAYRNAGRSADAAAQQAVLDKLRQAPEGEFTDFLKRLGDKAPPQ